MAEGLRGVFASALMADVFAGAAFATGFADTRLAAGFAIGAVLAAVERFAGTALDRVASAGAVFADADFGAAVLAAAVLAGTVLAGTVLADGFDAAVFGVVVLVAVALVAVALDALTLAVLALDETVFGAAAFAVLVPFVAGFAGALTFAAFAGLLAAAAFTFFPAPVATSADGLPDEAFGAVTFFSATAFFDDFALVFALVLDVAADGGFAVVFLAVAFTIVVPLTARTRVLPHAG